MGGGGGPTLKASLSRAQFSLAGTTATTATQSVAFFGFGNPTNNTVDTFDGNNDLGRETLTYEGTARYGTAATNITCGNESYALFGGGVRTFFSNNVDIFKCNDDGVFYNDTLEFNGPGRYNLAATSVTCGNDSYALFGGGADGGIIFNTDVDIFKCNDDGVFNYVPLQQFTGPGRSYPAATSVTCGNDSYALFGGGYIGSGIYSNNVNIFKCNDNGLFNDVPLQHFAGPGRSNLAATSVTCGNDSYALFGGGRYFDSGSVFSNDVDIFKCNDDGLFNDVPLQHFAGPARDGLAATSVTCGNASYALFGGGFSGSGNYSNDVDIFKCNDTGVFYHNTIQFNGPARDLLAATTVKVDGKEYALFAGGQDSSNRYDTIDIYDCETEQFLPL